MRQLLSDIALIPDNDRRGKTFERALATELRQKGYGVWQN